MNKTTLGAVGVFAILLVLALVTREDKVSVGIKKMEVPAVKKEDVTAMEVSGSKSATLVKQGEGWLVLDPAKPDVRFPTDENAVKSLVDAFSDFKADEFITDKADKQEEFEINDAKGLRVKLKAGDKALLDVVFGKFAKNGGFYVRTPNSNDVYITKSKLASQARKDVSGWRKRMFVPAKAEELTSVSVKLKGAEPFTVERDAEGKDWKLKDGTPTPAGFRFDAQAAGRLGSSLVGLRAQEFLDNPGALPADLIGLGEGDDTLTATTKDGRTLVVHLGRPGENDDQSNANTLKSNLEPLDSDPKDGKVTREELQKFAADAARPEDQRKAVQRVLDNPTLFDRLDLGFFGGGTKDGALTQADLEAAAKTASLTAARLDGDTQIYLVPAYSGTQLRKKLTDLRDLTLTKLDVDKAKKLSITSGDKKAVVTKGEGGWTLVEPKQAPAGLEFDGNQAQSQLNMIKNLRAARLVEPALTDAQTGLNKPATVVEVTLDDGTTATVRFGKEVPGDGKGAKEVYAKGSADSSLYAATEFMKKRYDNPVELFRKPKPPPQGMGGGMNGLDQLPPEIRKQLEAQMRQQGGIPR